MNTNNYAPPSIAPGVDLDLSRNEGRDPREFSQGLVLGPGLALYPSTNDLRNELAKRYGLSNGQVLLTSGGDGALLRTCLATLREGGVALIARPTFEMIPRYVELAGGTCHEFSWPEGDFPVEAMIAASELQTRLVFVVSPNNPTGAVASATDVRRIAEAMPQTLVVLDAAYGELAGADPTMEVLDLPNVVVVRTFSKAWGLASLRVGYLLGSETNIAMLGASGNPFPVSQMAANLALARLRSGESDMLEYARQVRFEREDLMACFETYGYSCAKPNEANFVLVRGLPVLWFKDSLGALGIAVRIFPDRPELQDAVRISLPGDDLVFARLKEALAIVMEPEAILFDLDGVLADVSRSYREAIIGTAAEFGVALTAGDIEEAKRRGQANDDWELTRTLIAERAVPPDLAEVTERFERLYQGTELEEGLRERETLLVSKADLQGWAARFRIGIVTGRPRRDAERFLERFALSGTFEVLVCREDAALKPSPEPVMLALGSLGVKRAWMLGDTRDDLEAARIAGVLPVGVIPPGVDPGPCRAGLMANGASLVVQNAQEIGEYLSCK